MITALDHIVIVCPQIESGELAMSAVLGRDADWRANDPGGAATLVWRLANCSVELMAPVGGGPVARRLHALLEKDGSGLKTLVFEAGDLLAFRTVLDRRGLKPDEIQQGESLDPISSKARYWQRTRLEESATHGVRVFVIERRKPDALQFRPAGPAAAVALDHVVVNTHQPDRACALYGARLGLRLALDRSSTEWDQRLMFFRIGDLTLEVTHRLSKGVSNQPDKLFGLAWRVPDIEAAHLRIEQAGLPVTSIRAGRRVGTKVFTVRDGTLGVPTLILSEDPARSAG